MGIPKRYDGELRETLFTHLYIVTLLIYIKYRVHHAKCWAG